jgi:uncharacterized protein (TIGR03437 family)
MMRLSFALICLTAVAYAQSSTLAITSASPNPIDAGGPAFTLTVKVSAFVPGAVVKWSGTPLANTTFVDDNTLTVTVPAGLIAICGKYLLTVTNNQNNSVSNSYPVIVNPVLNSISPNLLPAGSGGTTVTASGLGFSSNVYLTLNASGSRTNLATNYGGPTTLTAFVPASALNGIYPAVSLFVADPTTGAVSQTLPITLTFATVTAIAPNTIYADIATYLSATSGPVTSFPLNVGGANFVPGAQVLWNGTPLATVYNASNFLIGTVPADLVHNASADNKSPRLVGVSVKNPGAAASNALTFVILPNPFGTTIISLTPPSAVAGGPGLTLIVTGERYVQGSTVLWFSTPLSTTFVSATQLTATVPVALVATASAATITVSTPGVVSSNSVNFPIIAVSPTISPNGISPSSAIAGGPAFTMTVTGDGFVLASQVTGLDGATTTYVSLNQLTVSVPASAIANVGSHVIQVVSPGPLVSPQAPVFTVKAPTPAITSVIPASTLAGGPDFTLTVNGGNFPANSIVQWNGAKLVTTFVNASQLTALVPAALFATAGTASVTVAGDGGPSNALPFTIAPQVPGTSSAGILNAASSMPAIAPGTLIAIYGSNLAAATAQFSAAPLPLSLGGTAVSINGTPAPLLYASPGQVNAQVPYETKVGTAKLVVTSSGVPSPAVNFEVAATGPGVFTPQGSTHVLALNLADGTLNAAQTPARPGQYVTAYLTGQGLVDPAATTGDVAPSSPPFPTPIAPVVVKIGGQIAGVQFAGLAPGFIGLLQINVLIPDVPPGEQSFDVSIGAVLAAPTVISIASKAP